MSTPASSKRSKHVEYHRDGSLRATGWKRGGLLDGDWVWFRLDGTRLRSGSFERGQQTGTWTTYDRRGTPYKVTEMTRDGSGSARRREGQAGPRAKRSVASVQAYLAALDPGQARALRSVLAQVRKTVPEASQLISYGIPAFKLERVFLYCAAFKRHIGLFPPVKGDARLVAALRPYANAKGNLSFPLAEPLPLPLIARVTKALVKQYARPRAARSKRKGSRQTGSVVRGGRKGTPPS